MQHGSRPPACVAFYIFYLNKYDECVYMALNNREIVILFNNYRRTLTIMEETHERII